MEQLLVVPGIFITLLFLTWPSAAQRVPPVACPQYFEYLSFNQEYVGRIAVRHDPRYQENTLSVQFSQRSRLNSDYVGSLTLWDDEQVNKFNLRNGNPIKYRIDFPTPEELPKLTLVMINDVVLCRASPYPPSSVTLSLSHSLRSTTSPLFIQQPQFVQQTNVRPVQRPQRPFWQDTFVEPEPEERPTFRIPQPPAPAPATPPPSPPASSRPPTQPSRAQPRPSVVPNTSVQGLTQLGGICGREGPITSPLIHHGTQVRRGQLPWMVALYERGGDGLRFFCGGTLISASTVLSAAHCFLYTDRNLPANRAVVSLGRNTLDLVSDGLLREVSVLVLHEEYAPQNYTDADIALLKLASPVSFGEFIKPICLWSENFLLQLPSGYKSYVAGWGSDENGNVNTRVAKMTDTDIVTESECLRNLRSTEGLRLVTPNTICAGNKQAAGPCSGDSGGGLMLQENNIWLLRGVVSAGQVYTNRCDLTQPVIYTDLARHIIWLREKIWL
ncbi:serine protease 42 [Drosophila virilis]|uniref:Peptidase S1 domain-containing protein n=1 Tax=Drosophila virilis TaxID=7244 RepID=B4M049_DROVI|nr:serine protease 42 [Drosophila virilis]EDW68299.1 uncharacterized protein Dvir_GJ22609 [Drosophila virilis]